MKKAFTVALSLTAMLAAGCTDTTMSAPKENAPSSALLAKGGNGKGHKGNTATDTSRFSFTIDPVNGSIVSFGSGNYLKFPKASLCDPYTSSYGPGTWDDPCDVATQKLQITAKFWIDELQHPRVDFSPSVRFVPTTDPAQYVTVTFKDAAAAQQYGTVILYCRDLTTACVPETSDPTMATVTDPVTGSVTRRIKHFSGYSITTGEECYDFSDPDCVDSGSLNRFVRKGGTFNP